MSVYVAEEFTSDEADILRRYFTNLDRPVFALVNLPEVVKGALFARYSRSPKSLRRLFLDEFVGDLDITGDQTVDATVGLSRAEELYRPVFFEYGDDSVAQLGGVHLACEQASNLLTKVLEWGRLMAYLEQSTRYIAYDARIGGRYRYYRDPDVLQSQLGTRYVGDMDRLFDTYAELVPDLGDFFRDHIPKDPADSDFVYRQSIRAKAFDRCGGSCPRPRCPTSASTAPARATSSCCCACGPTRCPRPAPTPQLMLTELRKVIPSFLRRVDVPDRGVAWSNYLAENRMAMDEMAAKVFPTEGEADQDPSVTLVDFDPDAEVKMVASMLYAHTDRPEAEIEARVRAMAHRGAPGRRPGLLRRPHQPPPQARAGPRAQLLPLRRPDRLRRLPGPPAPPHADHRVAAAHAPARLHPARGRRRRRAWPTASTRPWSARRPCTTRCEPEFPDQASYAVALAYRIRFVMQINARAAMHMLELRTTPQGHPAYRWVAQQMHELIADEAGHHAVAELMRFVDHEPEPELERLEAERRAEARRQTP